MGSFSIVMVPTTECNLRCGYCFENPSPAKMRLDDVRLVFQRLRDFSQSENIRVLSFFWQGGEVMLLGPQWLRSCLEEADRIFDGSGVKLHHALQSNLMLYDDSWRDLVVERFGSSVSTSVDYPNLFRGVDGRYGDRHNSLWLEKYEQAKQDGLKVGAIAVLNAESLRVGPDAFLETMVQKLRVTDLQINLPFSTPGTNPGHYIDADATGEFLAGLFHLWHSSFKDQISLNPFQHLALAFNGNKGTSLPCIWGGDCFDRFISIGPDLDVAACDCWVTSLPDYIFGNLRHDSVRAVLNGPVRQHLKGRNAAILQGECLDCSYLPVCFGGCPVRSLGTRGNPNDADPYCRAYKQLFDAILNTCN